MNSHGFVRNSHLLTFNSCKNRVYPAGIDDSPCRTASASRHDRQ